MIIVLDVPFSIFDSESAFVMASAASMSSDATPDGLDDVFVRETSISSEEGETKKSICDEPKDFVEDSCTESEVNKEPHIVTGVARRILIDDETETMSDNIIARNELLRCAKILNKTSYADVERFVQGNIGRRFPIDQELEVHFVIGDLEAINPKFDMRGMFRYSCTARSYRMMIIGKIVFGSGEHGLLTVIYTAGDRCYVHSEDTDTLYIVSERGLTELMMKHGHRNIYEIFDRSVLENEDSGVPIAMISLAMAEDAEQVSRFVRDRVGLSTYKLPHPKWQFPELGGYFMVGDEIGLGLGKYFPDLVFVYLHEAGYHVLGRAELEFIVLYNANLEIFVLLDYGVVLKVANTIQGFLRDRLRFALRKYRRCFRPISDEHEKLCVGQTKTFKCNVEYVVPGGSDFKRWLESEEQHPITVEKRTSILESTPVDEE